jgi:hypothetical protein
LKKSVRNIKETKNSDLEVSRISLDLNISHTTKPKKILSFGNSFIEMTKKDYKEYINITEKTRKELFNRTLHI